MENMLDSHQVSVTQLDSESTSSDPPLNMENYNLEERFADKSSLFMVQLDDRSQFLASDISHQPLESSLLGVKSLARKIQRQLAQSRPKPLRSNKHHSESNTHVDFIHNLSPWPQDSSLFPLEYPPYPTNDVNFDEWTDYATYCGTELEPEILNFLSNEENASLHKKYSTPQSVDDVNSENLSSYAKTVTLRPRTHNFGVKTAQPTKSNSLI